MSYKLPPEIASPQDLTNVIRDIQCYSAWYEHESIKQKMNVATLTDQPSMSPAAAEILKSWQQAHPTNPPQLTQLIDTLAATAHTAPVMTITLAAAAPQRVKAELVAWCRNNLDETLLVNFRVNSTILGGMVVRYGSRIYDWSFRRTILARAHTIPEILSRV